VSLEILLRLELRSEHFAGVLGEYTHLYELTERVGLIAEEVFLGGIANLQILNEHKLLIDGNQLFRPRLLVPDADVY